MKLLSFGFFLVALALASLPCGAWGSVLPLPAALPHEVLSEAVPTAFAPTSFEAADFQVEWDGNSIPGVSFSLGNKSLEWVRASELLVLPRARLLLTVTDVESGRLTHAGFSYVLVAENGVARAELPVALISSERNPVEVRILRGGKEIGGKLKFRFKPRSKSSGARVFRDASCSRFGITTESMDFKDDEWAYLGCRLILAEGNDFRTAALELYLFWDNVGQEIKVGGVTTHATALSVWPMRLSAKPGHALFGAGDSRLKVNYRIQDRMHLGFLGVGIGPYQYYYNGIGKSVNSIKPIITLYGSFFITESARLVAFDATAMSEGGYTDFGFYLNYENFKILDRRLAINLLLGAHVIGFRAEGKTYVLVGAPQGLEMIFSDAFLKGYNLSVGGFLYPRIAGKSYNNVWLRWGGKFFAEANFIQWEEHVQEQRVYSKSVGLSFGFPFAQFF